MNRRRLLANKEDMKTIYFPATSEGISYNTFEGYDNAEKFVVNTRLIGVYTANNTEIRFFFPDIATWNPTKGYITIFGEPYHNSGQQPYYLFAHGSVCKDTISTHPNYLIIQKDGDTIAA